MHRTTYKTHVKCVNTCQITRQCGSGKWVRAPAGVPAVPAMKSSAKHSSVQGERQEGARDEKKGSWGTHSPRVETAAADLSLTILALIRVSIFAMQLLQNECVRPI